MTQLAGQTTWSSRLGTQSLSSWRGRLADFSQLTKPRLSVMVVLTAYVGFAMGVKVVGLGYGTWMTLMVTLAGVMLSCMGASVLNQVYEWDTDALMTRTKNRPLPGGRMEIGGALVLGGALCVGGVAILAIMANLLTAGLAILTIASYALVYTPLKRITSVSTIVGAFPGAIPPVMGFTAATGQLGIEAWLLFSILFVWQLPHFLAIAWLYRDEYAKAKIVLLPVVDPTGASTFRQIVLGCLALVPLSLLPTIVGVSGVGYFVGSLIAGTIFLGFGLALAMGRSRRLARAMFVASLIYLPVVYGLMLTDQSGVG